MVQQWPVQFNRRSFISGIGAMAALSLANVTPGETAQEPLSGAASAPGAARRIPDTDDQRISDLVAGNHILFDQGIVDGFGHVSVRSRKDPTHYFLSQSRAPGLVARDDIMEFDLDSKPVDPRGRPMYGERFIHGEILRARADVQSVVHSHASAVIPFTVTGAALHPMIHTAGFLPQNVPTFEIRDVAGADNGILIHDGVSGAAVAKALGNSPVVLMRGHGMAVVGPSVRHAVYRAIYTQLNAQIQLQAMLIGQGKITFLNPMEAANVDATNEGGLLTESPRQWDYLGSAGKSEHVEAHGSHEAVRWSGWRVGREILPFYEARMKERRMVSLLVFIGLLTVNGQLLAHHGTAAYADKITEIKQAVVTKFLWSNPHTLIDFDAKNVNGEVVHWTCETAAPQALRLIGWSKASLEPGDVVTVNLYVAKNGNPVGRLQKIVRADGAELHDTVLGGDAGGKTRYDPDAGKQDSGK